MKKQQWTTANIPSLRGKVMIITEADSSLGYEAAKTFATKGSVTVLACTDTALGARIKTDILKTHDQADIRIMSLDLRDPKSIQEFAEDFSKSHERLDVLMNIGDSHTIPAGDSSRFFGSHFASNHAGHFLLTVKLLGKLATTSGSRVVNLSQGEHRLKPADFNHLWKREHHRNPWKNKIRNQKWANMFFTYELQKFFESSGVDCAAVAAWPGPANRNLLRRLRNRWYWRLFKPFYGMVKGPDPLNSALPGIRAALSSDVKGGEYYGPDGFVDVKGYPSYSALLHLVA